MNYAQTHEACIHKRILASTDIAITLQSISAQLQALQDVTDMGAGTSAWMLTIRRQIAEVENTIANALCGGDQ